MYINELYNSKSGICVIWTGNDGWVINLRGTVIATDLDLHTGNRVPLPRNVDIVEMASNIRALFITHGHGDHFNEDTCRFLSDYSNCVFIIPKSCMEKAAEIGIDSARVITSVPGETFKWSGLDIRPVRALHGHFLGSVYSGASFDDCGYMIGSGGFTLYQPGDTVLLNEHFNIRGVDLLFVSPTEHNTWIDNTVRLIRLLAPAFIIPQHYDSYIETPDNAFWTRGFPDEVYDKLTESEKKKYIKIPQGLPLRLL